MNREVLVEITADTTGFVEAFQRASVTIFDLDTIRHLDFDPDLGCEQCEDAPATWKVRMHCGCAGLFCLRCLKAFKQQLKNCQDSAILKGAVVWWFDCADCKIRMHFWPIAEVTAL